jgi:ABC-type multidrug transport system ATPase subunit
MLTGLMYPTSGRASILGSNLFHDVTHIKKQIGGGLEYKPAWT